MWINQLNRWKKEGSPCAIVTIIAASGSTPRGVGAKMIVNSNGDISGSIGGGGVEHLARAAAIEAITANSCVTREFSLLESDLDRPGTDKSLGVCGGTVTIFIEPIMPQSEIVAFGAGHIAEKLGKLCDILNVPYRIYDNRAEYASAERFPNARERIVAPFEEIDKHIKLSNRSYCAIFTHGHKYDRVCFEQILANKDVPYIGMIGSASKFAVLVKELAAQGVHIDKRVYSPIGLKLGTQLPEEIAFSILAEIYLLMNGGTLEHYRNYNEKLKPLV